MSTPPRPSTFGARSPACHCLDQQTSCYPEIVLQTAFITARSDLLLAIVIAAGAAQPRYTIVIQKPSAMVTSDDGHRRGRCSSPALATIAATGGISSASPESTTAAMVENRQMTVQARTTIVRHSPMSTKYLRLRPLSVCQPLFGASPMTDR